MNRTVLKSLLACATPLFFLPAHAGDIPQMEGTWTGDVRQLSSGSAVSGEVASGGVLITEVALTLTIIHQDGEVFIGEVLTDAADAESTPVWGSIRSRGDEGIFVTGNGGRGDIWFESPRRFEFCVGNLQEAILTSYCGHLDKQVGATN